MIFVKKYQISDFSLYNLPDLVNQIQAWIAQLVAHRLGTIEVMGTNPCKGEDFSKKLINLNAD